MSTYDNLQTTSSTLLGSTFVTISLFRRNHTSNLVQLCDSELHKACEGTLRVYKDTISDHLITMLELVDIQYFSS
jgi:hypothetical protein